MQLGGKQLRVERPRDYAPMPEHMLDELRSAGLLGNTAVAPGGMDLAEAKAAGIAVLAVAETPPPPPALDTSAPTEVRACTGSI